MRKYFADFHIHVGRAGGKPVKMAASSTLTLARLIDRARNEKGLDIITVIDGVCTNVLTEFRAMIASGEFSPLPEGGYQHANGLVTFLGSEVEISGPYGGAAHFGCWFGDVGAATDFNVWLATVQKNVSLSSQKAYTDADTLAHQVHQRGGIFVVHHAFTPHKGLYGNCVSRISDMIRPEFVDALELGLSADSNMADYLSELGSMSFLSNSDAHSLGKIAREYNQLKLTRPTFAEVRAALRGLEEREIVANFGLAPQLGKYHRSYCMKCGSVLTGTGDSVCQCQSRRQVQGVYDRLVQIRDRDEPVHPASRPPYIHHVPLEFIPGLGPKLRSRLLEVFGTELAILHEATLNQLSDVVGKVLADRIDLARSGKAAFISGGGGAYGKMTIN
jgi:uncharacterized protein (TIGR00375 family)